MNLRELIRATKGDRSYDDLAREAGGSPSRQRWQQFASEKPMKNFPDPTTIRSMARTLRVGEPRVIMAAAATLGFATNAEQGRFAALVPPDAEQLTDKQIAAVLAVVDAMLQPALTPEDNGLPTDDHRQFGGGSAAPSRSSSGRSLGRGRQTG
jgi:hypothetical protein